MVMMEERRNGSQSTQQDKRFTRSTTNKEIK